MIKHINIISLVVALCFILGSIPFFSSKITVSLFLGSLITISSFVVFQFIIVYSMSGKVKTWLPLVIILKLILLFVLLWLIVTKLPIHLLAFLIGLSTIVIAIIVFAFKNFIKQCLISN